MSARARRLPAGALAAACAALGAAACAALGAAACIVSPDIDNEAYYCDGVGVDTCAPDDGCAAGSGPAFCAPRCDESGGCAAGEECSRDGLCISTCAMDSDCVTGLVCIEASDRGYCATGETCATNDDCSPLATGFGLPTNACTLVAVEAGNRCLFACNTSADCPPDQTCAISDLLATLSGGSGICAVACRSDDSCPVTEMCVLSAAVGPNAICLPGFTGFECGADTDCLMGACETVGDGAGSICTTPCLDDTDCAIPAFPAGTWTCDEREDPPTCTFVGEVCGSELCSIVDLGACNQLLVSGAIPACEYACIPGDIECPQGPTYCATNPFDPMAASGLCLQPCSNPRDCTDRDGYGCFFGRCVPGFPLVPCEEEGDCVPGGVCLDVPLLGRTCQYPCTVDSDCEALEPLGGPTLPSNDYSCTRDIGGTMYCET